MAVKNILQSLCILPKSTLVSQQMLEISRQVVKWRMPVETLVVGTCQSLQAYLHFIKIFQRIINKCLLVKIISTRIIHFNIQFSEIVKYKLQRRLLLLGEKFRGRESVLHILYFIYITYFILLYFLYKLNWFPIFMKKDQLIFCN